MKYIDTYIRRSILKLKFEIISRIESQNKAEPKYSDLSHFTFFR